MNFINNGTDEQILKSLPTENISEDLIKAMNKQGLVQKEVQVRGKNGQIFTRKQWVKVNDVDNSKSNTIHKKPQERLTTVGKDSKLYLQNEDGVSISLTYVVVGFSDEIRKKKFPHIKNVGYADQEQAFRETVQGAKPTGKDICEALNSSGITYRNWKVVEESDNIIRIQCKDPSGNKRNLRITLPKQEQKNTTKQDVSKLQGKTGNYNGIPYKIHTNNPFDSLNNKYNYSVAQSQIKNYGFCIEDKSQKGKNPLMQCLNNDRDVEGIVNEVTSKGSSKTKQSVIGSDYTKLTTEKESGTIEGEAHNIIVGRLKSEGKKQPTESGIKAAANSLKEQSFKTIIRSFNKDEMKRELNLAKQFSKLAGEDIDYMTLESIFKDVVSSKSGYTQEQRCMALSKLLGDSYYPTGNGDVVRHSNNSLAQVHIEPKSGGYYEVTFSYDDSTSYKDTYDSVNSAKNAADKFINKEQKYTKDKKTEDKKPNINTGKKLSKEDAKKKTQSFTSKVGKTDKERTEFMNKVKANKISWKETENSSINWMRCLMAMNEHFTNGGDFNDSLEDKLNRVTKSKAQEVANNSVSKGKNSKFISNFLKQKNYSLGVNERGVGPVTKIEVLSEPNDSGKFDIKVHYDVDIETSYTDTDSDGVSRTVYETETESRTQTETVTLDDFTETSDKSTKSHKLNHTTLNQVKNNRWEDDKGNSIWKDDFGKYQIKINGTHEVASSLESALKVMDSDRYWKSTKKPISISKPTNKNSKNISTDKYDITYGQYTKDSSGNMTYQVNIKDKSGDNVFRTSGRSWKDIKYHIERYTK